MQDSDERFWQLIEACRAPLWRFALGLTRSREDAKDLVSDAVSNHTQTYGGILLSFVMGDL